MNQQKLTWVSLCAGALGWYLAFAMSKAFDRDWMWVAVCLAGAAVEAVMYRRARRDLLIPQRTTTKSSSAGFVTVELTLDTSQFDREIRRVRRQLRSRRWPRRTSAAFASSAVADGGGVATGGPADTTPTQQAQR